MAGMRYQPQGRARIRQAGLGAKLVASVVGSQYQSGALNRPITLAAGVSRVVTQPGVAFQHSASNGNVGFGAPGGLSTLAPIGTSFSVYMRLFVSVLGVRQGLMTDHDAAGGNDSYTIEITAANEWKISIQGGANAAVLAGVTLGWHDLLVVYRAGSGHQIYVDGANAGFLFAANLTAGTALRLGSFGVYPTLGFQGRTAVCHIFRGDVSDHFRQLSNNPWQVFEDANEDEDELAAAAVGGGVSAALTWMEQGETTSVAAAARVTTSASWTEASDVTGVTVAASVKGSAAWTESGDSASLSASVRATAAVAWTEGAETSSIGAAAQVFGATAWTEAGEATAANVLVGNAVAATAEWSEAGESASIAAIAKVSATAAWVESGELVSIAASVGNDVALGAAWTEAGETSGALATVRVNASAGWAEQSDTTGFSARVLASAGLALAEANEVVSMAASVSAPSPSTVDASKVPSSRTIVSRGGARVVIFPGGTRTVRF